MGANGSEVRGHEGEATLEAVLAEHPDLSSLHQRSQAALARWSTANEQVIAADASGVQAPEKLEELEAAQVHLSVQLDRICATLGAEPNAGAEPTERMAILQELYQVVFALFGQIVLQSLLGRSSILGGERLHEHLMKETTARLKKTQGERKTKVTQA